MKKIIIIALAALTLCYSCQVHTESEIQDISVFGLLVYSTTTDYSISHFLLGLDNVLKAEEIVFAPSEKQDSLEDLYFPFYKIRFVEDFIYIKDYASIKLVNNIPIGQIGAIRHYSLSSFEMSIECVGVGEYILKSSLILSNPTTVLYIKLGLNEMHNNNNSRYVYYVSGSGLYSEYTTDFYGVYNYSPGTEYSISSDGLYYEVNYTIKEEEPLVAILAPNASECTRGLFRYIGGSVRMEVSGDRLGDEKDIVEATIKPQAFITDNVIITIRYRGKTYTGQI